MDYREPSVKDKDSLGKMLSEYGRSHCDYLFQDNICYSHLYHPGWTLADGFCILRFSFDKSSVCYLPPMGEGDFTHLIPEMESDARKEGKTMYLWGMSYEQASGLRSKLPEWGFAHKRIFDDYIYLLSDLKGLKGSKYQQKRNHIHRFTSLYDYEYVELGSAQSLDDCLKLAERWMEDKMIQGEGIPEDMMEDELNEELLMIRTSLENYRDLGLSGGALYVDGKVVAFTFGAPVNGNTFCTQVEKADTRYEGAFTVMNWEFANRLPEQYIYIDREWDSGVPGLRKAKLSYHPYSVSEEIVGRRLTSREQQLRQLWLECFPEDGPGDADEFIINRMEHTRMLTHNENGMTVSMVNIIPFGDTAYLFACCTSKPYRGRGLFTTLMNEAICLCRQEGFSRIACIPASDSLRELYGRFGFTGEHPATFETADEFCFGTGVKSRDTAAILTLSGDPVPDGAPLIFNDYQSNTL